MLGCCTPGSCSRTVCRNPLSLIPLLVPSAPLRPRSLQLPGTASGGWVQHLPLRDPRPPTSPARPQLSIPGLGAPGACPLPAPARPASGPPGPPRDPGPRASRRGLLGPPEHGGAFAGPKSQLRFLKPQAVYYGVSSLFIGLFILFIFLFFLLGIIKNLRGGSE